MYKRFFARTQKQIDARVVCAPLEDVTDGVVVATNLAIYIAGEVVILTKEQVMEFFKDE